MAARSWFYLSADKFEDAWPACEKLHAQKHSSEDIRMIWNDDMTACLVNLDSQSQIPGSKLCNPPQIDPAAQVDGSEVLWADDTWCDD